MPRPTPLPLHSAGTPCSTAARRASAHRRRKRKLFQSRVAALALPSSDEQRLFPRKAAGSYGRHHSGRPPEPAVEALWDRKRGGAAGGGGGGGRGDGVGGIDRL